MMDKVAGHGLDNVDKEDGHGLDTMDNAFPLKEAAERLGITPDALRKRWKRGKIDGFTLDGLVYIYLDSAARQRVDKGLDNMDNSSRLPVPIESTSDRDLVLQISKERDFLKQQVAHLLAQNRELQEQNAEERGRSDANIQTALQTIAKLTGQEPGQPPAEGQQSPAGANRGGREQPKTLWSTLRQLLGLG